MSIDIKIPKVGESISEVQISEWLKAAGDMVNKDEPLAIIDSEKTTFELPATDSGRLAKILHQAGETVSVGSVVAQLEPGETAASPPAAPKPQAKQDASPAASKPSRLPAPQDVTAPPAAPRDSGGTDRPGPPPRKPKEKKAPPALPAAERQTEPEAGRSESTEARSPATPSIVPDGQGERRERPSDGEEEVVPMTMLRRTVARRLVEARQTMAMLTTFNDVDMTAVQQLRHEFQESFQARHGVRLGLMSFFVKAAVDALKQYPQVNAEVRGNDIIYRNYFDIGVALASERGLVVPVLRRAERLSFAEIEKSIGDFSRRAKASELQPSDLQGGTFTITNGGVFGSLLSTPIINPPQSGILGLHAIEDRPVARNGQVVIRPMMYIALTYDHRIIDGREAVLFLRRIREAIESPARMLIEV